MIEHGGFSSAAKVLGLSKSAISKRITSLEAQLGVRLLHRTTRTLSLTEAGEHYYEHALRAYSAGKEAEDIVTQQQQAPQGTLKISTPMSFGRLHLASLIPVFLQRFPKIHIEMVMEDQITGLTEQSFDLAIRGGTLEDSSLVARKLTLSRNLICASAQYIETHGQPESVAELAQHNCLLFSYADENAEWRLIAKEDPAGPPSSVTVAGNYKVNNSEALYQATIQGLGIAKLPTFIASDAIKKGDLIELLPRYLAPPKTFYAIYPVRKYLPAKVRVFIDFLRDAFDENRPYWDC